MYVLYKLFSSSSSSEASLNLNYLIIEITKHKRVVRCRILTAQLNGINVGNSFNQFIHNIVMMMISLNKINQGTIYYILPHIHGLDIGFVVIS